MRRLSAFARPCGVRGLCRPVVRTPSGRDGRGRNRKEKTMTDTNTKNKPPMFRVTFSRIKGRDEHGNDVLASPREIGAIWSRKNGKAGGILDLDIIPTELVNRQGVIFIVPVDAKDEGGAQ